MAQKRSFDRVAALAAAQLIADLRLRRNGAVPPLVSLPEELRPSTIAEGYRIQVAALPLIEEGLGPQVGWKIGATSPAMQARLGLYTPVAGALYRDGVYKSPARIALADFCLLHVECEIGVRLGRNLPGRRGGHMIESVAPAVAAIMPSIELCEHRFVPPIDAGMATHVADDFFSIGAIFGPELPLTALGDPALVAGEIAVDGQVVFAGHASDILGHPLNALAWLADHCAEQGTPLKEGDVVSLGSISPGTLIDRACIVRVRFDGLGEAVVGVG